MNTSSALSASSVKSWPSQLATFHFYACKKNKGNLIVMRSSGKLRPNDLPWGTIFQQQLVWSRWR